MALVLAHCGGGDESGNGTETDTTGAASSTGAADSSTGTADPCGNGQMDPGEDCDDGNDVNGDGCNNDCRMSMQLQWVDTFDGGEGDDCAEGIAVDGSGNAIVAGYVATAGSGEDIWVRKYDPSGAEVWTKTVDGPGGGDDRARGIAADADGNIVVVGSVTGYPGEGRNIWVRRLDPGGETVWTDVHNGTMNGDDQGWAVTVTADAVVVAGEETVDMMDTDVWLRAYDVDGNEQWTQTYAGTGVALDSARGVATTPTGDIAVTGWITDATDGRMLWVRLYDATGKAVWTETFNAGSPNGNLGNAVATTSTGAVVVTGSSRMSTESTNIWTRMYDADGNEVWTDTFASLGDSPDIGRGVATSSIDQVTVVGTFLDSTDATTNIRLAQFTPDGEQLWSQPFKGVDEPESEGFAVAIGPDDAIAFAGCQFEPGTDGSGDVLAAVITPEPGERTVNPIARLGTWSRRGFGRVVPDPFAIAVVLTVAVMVAAMLAGRGPLDVLRDWSGGHGLWGLLAFTMQMCLMLVVGSALAAAPAVRRVLAAVVARAGTPRRLVGLTAAVAIVLALLNWSLGIIGGALVAREAGRQARRRGWRLHYPLLCAAGYAGLMVWHGGLSGSAPLKAATRRDMVEVLGERLADQVGTIPIADSLFGSLNLWVTGGLLVLGPLLFMALCPAEGTDLEATPPPARVEDRPEEPETPAPTGAIRTVGAVARRGLAAGGADGRRPGPPPGRPRSAGPGLRQRQPDPVVCGDDAARLPGSVRPRVRGRRSRLHGADPAVSPLRGNHGHDGGVGAVGRARAGVRPGRPRLLAVLTFVAAGLLNLFVPSGGGQWAVQGPILVEAAPARSAVAAAHRDDGDVLRRPVDEHAAAVLGAAAAGDHRRARPRHHRLHGDLDARRRRVDHRGAAAVAA